MPNLLKPTRWTEAAMILDNENSVRQSSVERADDSRKHETVNMDHIRFLHAHRIDEDACR